MKVLAISSSPRKGGNTDVLCDEFLKGAAESGHETKKIRLAEKKIAPCLACDGCRKTHVCVQKDDMADILSDMMSADVILFATPAYFYSVCSQMKILIDRCFVNHKALSGKKVISAITSADPTHASADGAAEALHGLYRCMNGAVELGVIYGCGAWDKGDIYRHPALTEAYEMGKNLQ